MKVAIMGYGTIGSGVAEILQVNKEQLKSKIGAALELKYILDLRDFPGDPNEDKIVKDYKKIAEDKDVRIVVETMGGVEPAFTFVKTMLEAGKAVCTSNKALVADKGAELLAIAKKNKTNFFFEASVGGGIPIIRTLQTALTGDVVEEITGILNGTTNFMLTAMAENGAKYADVLKEAQRLGYAEKDPTADVEGFDSCRKIAILTSLIAGQQVDFNDVSTEGITKITPLDMEYAAKVGYSIKLLATSKKMGDSYSLLVAPFFVSKTHPLYTVNGVFNSVFVKGNMLGDAMFYGSGAGKLPTASAVVADMVCAAAHDGKNIEVKWEPKKLELADHLNQKYRFFVRSKAPEGIIERVFENSEYIDIDTDDEAGFITACMTEREFNERARALGQIITTIRIAD